MQLVTGAFKVCGLVWDQLPAT